MNKAHFSHLVWTRRAGAGIVQQRYRNPLVARRTRPGQFVHLLPDQSHLFRRAFSVYAVDVTAGTFDVLIQVLGRGTQCLTALPRGAVVDTLGPLGNSFPPVPRGFRAVMVGGGVGMAPLRLLAWDIMKRRLGRNRRGRDSRPPLDLLLGSRTRSQAVPPYGLSSLGVRALWATDDGSKGYSGTVVGLLDDLLTRDRIDPQHAIVYGCGPEPMMRALATLCERNDLACYLSLERSMPCGYGVCMGCVVRTTGGDGYDTHRRVCRDGPVFDATEVIL